MGIVTHNGEVIADSVWEPDGFIDELRGLRFRVTMGSIGSVVFDANSDLDLGVVDTAFVFFPIDVVWTRNNRVENVAQMGPFSVRMFPRADTIIELPAGTTVDVDIGDTVEVHKCA